MVQEKTAKKLTGWDKMHYFGALLAALPFHLFLILSIRLQGISGITFLYVVINALLLFCMFKFMKYIYQESDSRTIIKKIIFYEIIPVVILFFAVVKNMNLDLDVRSYQIPQIFLDQDVAEKK